MSFWRKLNKVVFYVTLVIFILAWLFFTIFAFTWDYNWWWGFIIFGGGLIVIPTSFTVWGIMLEFVDNVAAIRQKVCSDQGQQPAFQSAQNVQSAQPVQNVQSAQPAMTAPAMMNMQQSVATAPSAPVAPVMQMPNYGKAPVAPVAPVVPVAPVNGKWTCLNCAKENDAISKFCHNCGSPRI